MSQGTLGVHDGLVHEARVWCTAVDGPGEQTWVGRTRLQATTNRRRLAWMPAQLQGTLSPVSHPTRVFELESRGVHAVFGPVAESV